MPVDVTVDTTIERPVAIVAGYAADPSNAPTWYRRIDAAVWVTDPVLEPGSEVMFRASFLGKQLVYTYEFVEVSPERSLTMRTAQGPFPMETTYTWTAVGPDRTRMSLRNRGTPAGFSKLVSPVIGTMMRRAMRQDLRQLKALLESGRFAV